MEHSSRTAMELRFLITSNDRPEFNGNLAPGGRSVVVCCNLFCRIMVVMRTPYPLLLNDCVACLWD
jgi:hypothetical protein